MKSFRLRLFLSHLAISAALVGSCVALILFVWYPDGLAALQGTYFVLLIMAGVDVAAGPICTLVVASPKKDRRELVRDLALIGAIQFLALGYALFTTGSARPAYIVYSFGQFDVEMANLVSTPDREQAQPPFRELPWLGPVYVGTRLPEDRVLAETIVRSTMRGGTALKDMPRYFVAWPDRGGDASARALLAANLAKDSRLRPALEAVLRSASLAESDALLLRIVGQEESGTVVLRKSDLSVVKILPGLTP